MRKNIRIDIACLALLLATAQASDSQTKTYRISPADSRIGFVATKWMVFKEEGRFTQFEGTLEYDAGNPSATRVNIAIQVPSVDSRDRDRDQVIRGESLLHAQVFPLMTFRSTGVQRGGRDTLFVTGNLSIRGTTKRVSIPVKMLGVASVPGVGQLAGFETEFAINRFDFGVAGSPNLIGRDIMIQLQIGAIAR